MTLERLQNLKGFLRSVYGLSWYKANLHVHAAGQDPKELVKEAVKAGIRLIAITDHNTFRFVKNVQDAAKELGDSTLTVLPGIEITLEEGAHIIAIFDIDFNTTKQTHFLGTLKLPVDATDRDATKDACTEILASITDAKGLTVVPHPFSDNIGFLDKARKMSTKISWLESGNIGLIQIPQEKVRYVDYDENGKWQNRYVLASLPLHKVSSTDYTLAPIAPGEAKTPTEIENGTVWLKLGSPTVRGLRQVTCEPRTCISLTAPVDNISSRLLGLNVRGGFFDGLKIGFSNNFTCIFGENHSGKTAIFDFISFALGRDLSVLSVNRDEERALLLRRLHAILKPDGEVDLYLLREGRAFCFSRKFVPTYGKDSSPIGSKEPPQAFEYDQLADELVPTDSQTILIPEIYSQGHIGIIRKSVQSQLSLIDELAGLSEFRKKREEFRRDLDENAEFLAGLYDEQERLAGSTGYLPGLKKELADYEAHLKETDNKLWENTRTLFEDTNAAIEQLGVIISDEEGFKNTLLMPVLQYEEADIVMPDLLKSISESISEYNKSIISALSQAEDSLSELKRAYEPHFDKWGDKFTAHMSMVTQLLRKKGFESPNQLLTKIELLRSQIKEIETKKLPRLKNIMTQIEAKRLARESLLKGFSETAAHIARARSAKIEELNELIGPDIRITLERSNLDAFLYLLKDIYNDIASQDRKLQKRDAQLTLIVNKLSPSELLEAIAYNGKFKRKDGTTATLCDECGITYNTQQVLCTITGAIKTLHKLQVFELEPDPKISVRREGRSVFADLRTELSPGEQSSSILALALMARNVPLIIDQPEDELGYSYIVNKIVPKILNAKRERQVILISHNANIPVLADADFLLKVRNDPAESESRCTVELSGTFSDENVCNKILELEGGERAFQIRQYRYAIPRRIETA